MARLAGLEPTASASAGLRSIQLSYKRLFQTFPAFLTRKCYDEKLNLNPLLKRLFHRKALSQSEKMPKEGFEPSRPKGHYALNVARLPFRHFGASPHGIKLGGTGLEPVTSCV